MAKTSLTYLTTVYRTGSFRVLTQVTVEMALYPVTLDLQFSLQSMPCHVHHIHRKLNHLIALLVTYYYSFMLLSFYE